MSEDPNAPPLDASEIDRARELIGVWLRRDVHWPASYEPISVHDIRRYAVYSIGDDNPLWQDEEYGKRSPYGSIVAPPTFLYSIDSTIVGPGLPGVQWIHGGNRWTFHRPIRPGDTIRAKARLLSVEEKSGRNAAQFVMQTGEVLFHNQRDELVGETECDILRVPRRRSGQGSNFGAAEFEKPTYTQDEIERIAEAYRTEERRGSEPRYWDDVQTGDALAPIVKGPLTLVDIVGFYAGRRNVYNVLKLAFLERDRHPRNVYVSPESGVPVHPAAGHFDYEIAGEIGMPTAYDQGWMRINWLGHLVTNWAGDHGWVRQFDVKNLRPNFVGNTCTCRGEIVDRGVERNDLGWVEVDLTLTDQLGTLLSKGRARVELPIRAIGDQLQVEPQ